MDYVQYIDTTMEVQVISRSVTDEYLVIGLSVYETARRTGVSQGFIRQEIRRGNLRAAKLGRRVVVPMKSIAEWLENSTLRVPREGQHNENTNRR